MDSVAPLACVTGAAGWLGRGLVRGLLQGLPDVADLRQPVPGLRVRCLVLPGEDVRPLTELGPAVEIVEGDVRRPADCERLLQGQRGAVVYHTAGIIHPRRVHEFYDINVTGTRQVVGAAIGAGARRVVVVSSNSPCGVNPHPDHLFDETSPYAPWLHYGRSKMEMERFVKEEFRLDRIETVLVRPPWFYGPFQPARQTLFFEMIEQGKAPIVGNGNNLRSMAYIDNLVHGLLRAAQVPRAAGETYWIADERPYSMNEIIDTVERLQEREFGRPVKHGRMRLPGLASEVAVWVDRALQGVGLYHQKIHVLGEMNKTIACSIDKARQELGYRPAIALEEGMRRSLAWLYDPNRQR